MKKFGNIEILSSLCNPLTVKDGRGGIFTWLPHCPIKEFNILYFHPNKVRGNHYHPEFSEYFLVVAGSGVMMTKDPKGGPELIMQMSEGTCVLVPPNVSHAFQAITETKCMSLISKPWDECDPPIIFENIIPVEPNQTPQASPKNKAAKKGSVKKKRNARK